MTTDARIEQAQTAVIKAAELWATSWYMVEALRRQIKRGDDLRDRLKQRRREMRQCQEALLDAANDLFVVRFGPKEA